MVYSETERALRELIRSTIRQAGLQHLSEEYGSIQTITYRTTYHWGRWPRTQRCIGPLRFSIYMGGINTTECPSAGPVVVVRTSFSKATKYGSPQYLDPADPTFTEQLTNLINFYIPAANRQPQPGLLVWHANFSIYVEELIEPPGRAWWRRWRAWFRWGRRRDLVWKETIARHCGREQVPEIWQTFQILLNQPTDQLVAETNKYLEI